MPNNQRVVREGSNFVNPLWDHWVLLWYDKKGKRHFQGYVYLVSAIWAQHKVRKKENISDDCTFILSRDRFLVKWTMGTLPTCKNKW
jgi:hypothetical protein